MAKPGVLIHQSKVQLIIHVTSISTLHYLTPQRFKMKRKYSEKYRTAIQHAKLSRVNFVDIHALPSVMLKIFKPIGYYSVCTSHI